MLDRLEELELENGRLISQNRDLKEKIEDCKRIIKELQILVKYWKIESEKKSD